MSDAAMKASASPPDGPAVPGALKVLLYDENQEDALAALEALAELGRPLAPVRVETASAFGQALVDDQTFDLILADGSDVFPALETARRLAEGAPFIYLAAPPTEAHAALALRRGATDYVLKNHLDRLVPAVRRALREVEETRARRRAEDQLRVLLQTCRRIVVSPLEELADEVVPALADGCAIDLLPPDAQQLVQLERSPLKIVAAIRAGDRLLGTVTLTSSQPRFGAAEAELAELLAQRAAQALEHERLIADARAAAARAASTLAELPVGVMVVDAPAGQVSYANPRAQALFGAAGPPHDHLARALGGEVISGHELPFLRPGEGQGMARVHAVPIRAAGGAVTGAIAAYDDISEAARIDDELLAILSHELRTPLNAVLGWARLLRTGKVESAQHHHAAHTIERNAGDLAQKVEALLDVSAIVAGQLSVEKRPADLRAAVRSAVESLRRAAEDKHLTVTTELGDDAPLAVLGDAARLEQIAWHLLSNAVKFTPEDGHIEVALRERGGRAVLTVRDSGQGIPADRLPRVFERFRGGSSLTRAQRGLGLGLWLVHRFVTLHGGSVSAESEGEQRGALFSVTLPVDLEAGLVAVSAPPPAPAPLLDAVVLVIEDEPDARDLLSAVLAMQGAQVLTAADAGEALAVSAGAPLSVIVSDIALPGRDGYALMRELRRRGVAAPAVALTAFATEDARARALASGYQAHVAKPFDPVELLALIGQLAGAAA